MFVGRHITAAPTAAAAVAAANAKIPYSSICLLEQFYTLFICIPINLMYIKKMNTQIKVLIIIIQFKHIKRTNSTNVWRK